MYPSDADRVPDPFNGETQETHTPTPGFSQEQVTPDLAPTQARVSQEGPTTPFLAPPPFDEPLYTSGLPQQASRPQWNWRTAISAIVLLAVLGAGVVIGLIAANAHASNSPGTVTTSSSPLSLPSTVQDLQQTIITVTHNVQQSVVEVKDSNGSGTGEFITKDGYIITNDHVVNGASNFSVVLANGTTQSAQLIGEDTQDDLAVLKTSISNATPITFGDSSKVQVGEFVLAIGAPLGLQESASFGIVSALGRTEQESSNGGGFFGGSSAGPVLTNLIQTSAPINPGNSGGALVDLQGQLIGITTLGATGTQNGETVSGIGFAIPSSKASSIANQLMQGGKVTSTGQGFLGIEGEDVTPDVASQNGLNVQQGVLVSGFANDASGKSPSQAAGMKQGDVITAVNGQTIADNTDLASAIITKSPGTTVTVTVERGSSQVTLHVTLGERPTNAQG
jgi:putative serine protease PepD